MNKLRRCVEAFATTSRLDHFVRYCNRRSLTVVTYHSVVEHLPDALSARPGNMVELPQFRKQMELLSTLYSPVSVHQVVDWLHNSGPLPPYPVLVTFDDGFKNNLECAAPELLRVGIPAVFAITTGLIGTTSTIWPIELVERILFWPHARLPEVPGLPAQSLPLDAQGRIQVADLVRRHCKGIPNEQRLAFLNELRHGEQPQNDNFVGEHCQFMNWNDVRRLCDLGFDIASHTVNHPILSRLSETDLRFELSASRERIEQETSRPCNVIAYPNGEEADVSFGVLEQARQTGYMVGFSQIPTINGRSQNPLCVGRFSGESACCESSYRTELCGLTHLLRTLWKTAL